MERLGRGVDYMNSQFSISRVALALLVILFFIVGIFIRPKPWFSTNTTQGNIVATHTEIQVLAMLLDEYFQSNKKPLPADNFSIRAALWATGTNADQFLTCVRTNSVGEMVDYWNVPYQIQIVGTTNFVIRSGGPNRKFGDQDDLIYDSTQ